jgi:hypothetical protein
LSRRSEKAAVGHFPQMQEKSREKRSSPDTEGDTTETSGTNRCHAPFQSGYLELSAAWALPQIIITAPATPIAQITFR